ncbi:MAG: DUF1465 family protein [Sphingomonas sp.]
MLLADEARAYFDEIGRDERETLAALDRVAFSCESLKVTDAADAHHRLGCLTQRAVDSGELAPIEALRPSRRLGPAPETEETLLAVLPAQATAIVPPRASTCTAASPGSIPRSTIRRARPALRDR